MKHQQHAPPDWLMEFSLIVFIVAILIMAGVNVVQRFRLRARKSSSRGKQQRRPNKRRRRRH